MLVVLPQFILQVEHFQQISAQEFSQAAEEVHQKFE